MAQYSPTYEEQRVVSAPGIFFLPIYLVTIVAVALLLAYFGPEEIRATVILLLLTPLTFLIFARATRADPDGEFLYKVLLLTWPAKLVSMGVKLYLLLHVFRSADAYRYHEAGQEIAATLASGGMPDLLVTSTQFVELFTGFFYFVTGPTFVGSWIFWSWVGTLGSLAFYKAFVVALPSSARRWFAVLLFFSPTMLFWTNSLGKDALISLGLGIATYGVAQVYRRGLMVGPLFWTSAGLGWTFLVRPHMAAIAAVALAGAILLRPIRAGILTPLIRIGTFVGVTALAVVVLQVAAASVSLELTVEGVSEFFETQEEQSQQGSTSFESVGFPTTPQAFALAVLTVIFRPFPWEADTVLGLGIALEGLALILLLMYRWRSVLGAIWEARRHAFLAFVAVYAVVFVILFSSVSNFGILARQRAQLLPFIFVLIAYQGSRREMAPSGSTDLGRAPGVR